MKILLVEDNELLAKGLIYSLEQKEYIVLHAVNINETLKIIKKEAGGEKSDIQCNFIVTRNV